MSDRSCACPPTALITGEGAEPPRPRATQAVAPPGSHRFCVSVLWTWPGTDSSLGYVMCQRQEGHVGGLFSALILMGVGCGSAWEVDTERNENGNAHKLFPGVREKERRRDEGRTPRVHRAARTRIPFPLTGAFEMGDPFSSHCPFLAMPAK